MGSLLVSDRLDSLQSVSVPKAYNAVLSNSNDLLLFIVAIDTNNFAIVVSKNAINYSVSIRVDEHKPALSTPCRHDSKTLWDVESYNICPIISLPCFVVISPDLDKVEWIKNFDFSHERSAN